MASTSPSGTAPGRPAVRPAEVLARLHVLGKRGFRDIARLHYPWHPDG